MRVIKFRGKPLNGGDWVVGSLIIDPKGHHFILPFDAEGIDRLVEVRPESVSQFSGLQDRYYQDIYENDLLMVWNKGRSKPKQPSLHNVGICRYIRDDSFAGWVIKPLKGMGFFNLDMIEMEIIGNISEDVIIEKDVFEK